jgi:hypothetical protein
MPVINALHIYAQHSNHDQARITGTKDELLALQEATKSEEAFKRAPWNK